MAFCIWSIISLMYFWTPFFVRIHHYDCLTLQPVDSCPENLFEVKAATIRLKCSDVKEFKNVYHCLPLSNLSRLVEFCYDGVSGLTEKGNCMVLENQHLNNHSCNQFTKGCPDAPYFPKNMFSFPACKQINKQNRCYVADPTCPPIISFVEETTVEVMKNNTVLVQGMMPTVTTKENNTFLTNKINPVLLTVAIAAIASTVALIALVITMKTKHRRSTKGRKIYQGNHNLNEGKYLLHQEDNITKRGVRFDIYECNGDRIRFIRLLDCLKNEIKETELISLKEYLKGLVPVKSLNEESLEKADSVKKFVDFVISEGIFTDRDVIIMQCLMRLIKRPKLDQECVDYATKKKERVCYFQEKEPATDGTSRVKLHVVDDIQTFTTLDSVIETVAAIVNCDRQSIDLVGIHPDSSFIIVIEMERKLAQLLSRKTPQELMKLAEFKIDKINIDGDDITITEPGNKETSTTARNGTDGNKRETKDKENIVGQSEKKERIETLTDTSSATQSIAEIQPRKYDVLARPNTPKEVKRAIFVHGNPVDEEEKPFQDIQVTSSPTQRIGKIQPRKYGVLTRPDIKKEVKHAMSVHGNPVDEEEKQFQSGKVTSSPTQRIGKIQPRKYGVLTRPDIKKEVKHAMSVHGNPVDEEEKPFQSGKVTSSPTQRIGKIQLRKYGVLTRPDIKKEVKHAMSVHGNPVDEEEKPFQSGKDASFSSITIPGVNGVYHISYVTSEKLWVSDNEWLLQVDFSGHEIEKTKTHLLSFTSRKGFHTVTMDGSLLFIDDYNNVQEVTSKGTNTTLITAKEGCEKLLCVHSSRINGDILLGCEDALIRYDRTGQQILDFMNGLRRGIYYPIYITENNNGDIWVSDEVRKAVVVVDKLKRERFYYRGQTPYSDFKPYGICTDILGQVLVCDDAYQNPSVHLLDHECRFLRLVLTRKHGIRHPLAVCVDEKQNLYLGQRNNMIKLYKYEGRSISNASYDISY